MFRKKGIMAIVMCIIGVLFFIGCGKLAKHKNTVEYMYSGGVTNLKQNEEMKKIFERENPDVKINLTFVENWGLYLSKILTSVAGNVPLDIIGVGSSQARDYMRRGICVPLDEYLKNDPEWAKIKEDIYPQYLLDIGKYKGKTYALPGWQNVDVLYYNKKLFDEAGIKYPDETWDINKFVEVGKKLAKDTNGDGKIDQYGAIFAISSFSTLWWFGGDLFNKEGTKSVIDSPESIKAMQWYVDLRDKYHIVPILGEDITDMSPYQYFMSGKVAMFVSPHYYKPQLMKIKDFEWDVAMLPKGKTGNRKIMDNVCCFVMLKTSKNPDKAWKLLKFLVSREYQEILSRNHNDMPISKTVLNSPVFLEPDIPPKNKKAFVDTLQYTATWPACMGNELADVLQREVNPALILNSKKSIKEACKEAVKQANILLEQQRKLENK